MTNSVQLLFGHDRKNRIPNPILGFRSAYRMYGVIVEPSYGLVVMGALFQPPDAILSGRGFARPGDRHHHGHIVVSNCPRSKNDHGIPERIASCFGLRIPGQIHKHQAGYQEKQSDRAIRPGKQKAVIGRSVRANRKPQSGNKRAETAFFMSSNFEYHKLYMPSACPENDTTEGLAFLSDDSKIEISQEPRKKKKKTRRLL